MEADDRRLCADADWFYDVLGFRRLLFGKSWVASASGQINHGSAFGYHTLYSTDLMNSPEFGVWRKSESTGGVNPYHSYLLA